MILKRFYDDGLAQASYLVGCPRSGEAIVIDPNRDAGQYLREAASEGVKIVAVTETHIHADYLSGTRELSHRTGATMFLSDEGGPDWKYGFADDPKVKLVRDGDSFHIGSVRFDVAKTPGHTPEHISFIVTDEQAGSQPMGAFTGDFIFVGDVGRPDLLEVAANLKGTMEAGARELHQSIEQFRNRFPDFLLLWPGHGAGSACGKSLGGVPVTSLGYEKAVNWALRSTSEQQFVDEVLTGQPDPPKYFAEMKRRNKMGPPILGAMKPVPVAENPQELRMALESGCVVVDIRPDTEHASGHVVGSIYIELAKSFTKWAGWLLPYDTPIYILSNTSEAADAAARSLRMIGLDDIRVWFSPDMISSSGVETELVRYISPDELSGSNNRIVDVRAVSEFEDGHVPGAINIPLGHLPERLGELTEGKYAVLCESGYRSSIAGSILINQGFEAAEISGGFDAYQESGLPIARDKVLVP